MPTRILIADDNQAVRTALRHLLEAAGADQWEIIEVEDGLGSIAKAQELNPDLIVLDLVMPVMDGLTAARKISRLLPETPLLMHTLHYSPQLEVEAQKVGVRKVLPKADTAGLISAIRQLLTSEPPDVVAADPANVLSNIPAANVAVLHPVLDSEKAPAPEAPPPERAGDLAGRPRT